ncbi:hypothetical protein HZU77_009765 [Neisseriaceae bacterium TC5R-5]|nr:hypothetical protein [Neisseriaceae bacterium TC5R-5]
MKHSTALIPTLRLMADFHRGRAINLDEAHSHLDELQTACFDGLYLLTRLLALAAQQGELSHESVSDAAWLQCLLAALGNECDEWRNVLEPLASSH